MRGSPGWINELERNKQEFLYYRDVEADAKTRKNKARLALMSYIEEQGEEDGSGNLRLVFEQPLTMNGIVYKGLMNQRRKATGIDEDLALELAEKAGVTDQIIRYEPVYDWEQLYILNQEGLITDSELDSVLTVNETWALVPIKES